MPVIRRRSSSLSPGEHALDEHWQVGGKYQIVCNMPIWASPEINEQAFLSLFLGGHHATPNPNVSELSRDAIVLLLCCKEVPGRPPLGYVLPEQGCPGWILLEDWFNPGVITVHKVKMPGSWDMGARYAVLSGATVRADKKLSSDWVAELVPGDEVLVLELAMNTGDLEGCTLRLRMKISADTGALGWISPQNVNGEMLLYPVNLLGHDVVKLRRTASFKTRKPSLSFTSLISPRGRQESPCAQSFSDALGKRKSFKVGAELPWVVGGQYRILETGKLKEASLLNSRDICRIPAGSLVTISRLDTSPPDFSPVALVTVQVEGYLNGCQGWIRCTAKDGHDLIDFRDQQQLSKVIRQLEPEVDKDVDEQVNNTEAPIPKSQLEVHSADNDGNEEQPQAETQAAAPTASIEQARQDGHGRKHSLQCASGLLLFIATSAQPYLGGCLLAMQPTLESLTSKANHAKAMYMSSSESSPRPA